MAVKTDMRELEKALNLITEECRFHNSSCSMCPLLRDRYICGICGVDVNKGENYKYKPSKWQTNRIQLFADSEGKREVV